MKILFQTNQLNYRGTSIACESYARYNQEILNNESIICYDKNAGNDPEMGNVQDVIDKISNNIRVIGYTDIKEIIEDIKPSHIYRITAGFDAINNIHGIKAINHAVFQAKNPHITAYVSQWLSNHMTNGKIDFVPHIVELPTPNTDYREFLNIPKSAICFGRYGGFHEFNIDFVKDAIKELVEEHSNFYFLFMNTYPFISHPQIKFIGATHDLQKKSNFIQTCDAMIHARKQGESFGMSVAEFLFLNKPALSANLGQDRNHIEMLKNTGTLYNNKEELKHLMYNILDIDYDFRSLVKEFAPDLVMKKFKRVFID